MDYELDEFEVEIDGVLVGLFFGSAWLESADRGSFRVHRVALAGRRGKTETTAIGGTRTTYSNAVLGLDARSASPLAHALFAAIARQLEDDGELQMRFAEQVSAA